MDIKEKKILDVRIKKKKKNKNMYSLRKCPIPGTWSDNNFKINMILALKEKKKVKWSGITEMDI